MSTSLPGAGDDDRRPPLIDYETVARRMGVTVRAVEALVHNETIPFVRVGPRFVRFDPLIIDAWIAANSRGVGDLAGAVAKVVAAAPRLSPEVIEQLRPLLQRHDEAVAS